MKNPKRIFYAVYPDGARVQITKRSGHYWFGRGSGSNTMQGVRENMEYLGGSVESAPNPHYRKAPGLFPDFIKGASQ
jgi:hypothetical protein